MTYQIAPWLEGTFRYTGFDEFFYWDRNYEVKARLWDEELFLPAVAVGIRDVVGTGVLGLNIWWLQRSWSTGCHYGDGLGTPCGKGDCGNPLTRIVRSFRVRDPRSGVGGDVSFGDFFSGPEVGLFGGVRYSLKNWPLTLLRVQPGSI